MGEKEVNDEERRTEIGSNACKDVVLEESDENNEKNEMLMRNCKPNKKK